MFYSNSSDCLGEYSSTRLQHALHDFKRSQLDKATLQRKLHIMKHKCETNRKKAKAVQSQVSKIRGVKEEHRRQQQDLGHHHSPEAELKSRKLRKEKTLRDQSKENMGLIRNLIQDEKSQEYHRIKQNTRLNQMKISQQLKTSLHEKRERSLEVRLEEESSRLNKTLFLENKRMQAKQSSEKEILPLEVGTD